MWQRQESHYAREYTNTIVAQTATLVAQMKTTSLSSVMWRHLHENVSYELYPAVAFNMVICSVRAIVVGPEIPTQLQEELENHRDEDGQSLDVQVRQHPSNCD